MSVYSSEVRLLDIRLRQIGMKGQAGAHSVSKMFCFDKQHNLPFPGEDTLCKYELEPNFESGIDFQQLTALLDTYK